MDKAQKYGLMAPLIQACIRMVKRMGRVNRHGLERVLTLVNSKMTIWKGMEYIDGLTKGCLKVTGKKI